MSLRSPAFPERMLRGPRVILTRVFWCSSKCILYLRGPLNDEVSPEGVPLYGRHPSSASVGRAQCVEDPRRAGGRPCDPNGLRLCQELLIDQVLEEPIFCPLPTGPYWRTRDVDDGRVHPNLLLSTSGAASILIKVSVQGAQACGVWREAPQIPSG